MRELTHFLNHSEAAVIVSGMGWDPEVKKYNRGRNVEIRHIEYVRYSMTPSLNVMLMRSGAPDSLSLTRLSSMPGIVGRITGSENVCTSV